MADAAKQNAARRGAAGAQRPLPPAHPRRRRAGLRRARLRGRQAAGHLEAAPGCRWARSTPSFPSKDDLFRAILEERGRELLRAGARGRGATADRRATRSHALIAAYIDYFVDASRASCACICATAPRGCSGPTPGADGRVQLWKEIHDAAGRHLPPRHRRRRVRRRGPGVSRQAVQRHGSGAARRLGGRRGMKADARRARAPVDQSGGTGLPPHRARRC